MCFGADVSQETSEQIDDITTSKVSDDYYDSGSDITEVEATETTAEDENKITEQTQKSIDDTTSNTITTKEFGKTVKTVTQAKSKAVTKAKSTKNSPSSDNEDKSGDDEVQPDEGTHNKAEDDQKRDKSEGNSSIASLPFVLLITLILMSVSTLIDNY